MAFSSVNIMENGNEVSVALELSEQDGDPYWTKTGSWTMGLDPLGLQATSIRIYQSLVPNITNITNRLRYYAYFPWLIELYEKKHHSDDPARFARFMRRGEALYALATVVNDMDGSDGLGGANWANQQRDVARSNGIDFRPFTDDRTSEKTYLQAARGNYGAAYAPTLTEMGWLTASSVPVTQGQGQLASAAFAGSIGPIADEIETVLLSGTATSQQLQNIGTAIHPAHIPHGSPEQAALRDFLLGQGDQSKASLARRASIWLVLDLYRNGIEPGDIDGLRQALYTRALPNGQPYQPPGKTVDRWRAYQANEYGHIALECALNGLVGLQCESYTHGIEPRQLVAKLVDEAIPQNTSTWSDWAEALVGLADNDEALHAEVVLENLRSGLQPTPETLLDAFKLLGILWAKWAENDGNVRPIIAAAAGRDGRSLDGILRTLDTARQEPVQQAIAAVLFRHIIIDHQIIAGRKLSAAGTFTYHFLVEDGLLSEGRLGEYGYTTPRLFNLTRVLRDAGYLHASDVTADGEAFLEQNQPL